MLLEKRKVQRVWWEEDQLNDTRGVPVSAPALSSWRELDEMVYVKITDLIPEGRNLSKYNALLGIDIREMKTCFCEKVCP